MQVEFPGIKLRESSACRECPWDQHVYMGGVRAKLGRGKGRVVRPNSSLATPMKTSETDWPVRGFRIVLNWAKNKWCAGILTVKKQKP